MTHAEENTQKLAAWISKWKLLIGLIGNWSYHLSDLLFTFGLSPEGHKVELKDCWSLPKFILSYNQVWKLHTPSSTIKISNPQSTTTNAEPHHTGAESEQSRGSAPVLDRRPSEIETNLSLEQLDINEAPTESRSMSIPSSVSEETEDDICLICRESSAPMREVVPCGHKFHEECIREVSHLCILNQTGYSEDSATQSHRC